MLIQGGLDEIRSLARVEGSLESMFLALTDGDRPMPPGLNDTGAGDTEGAG
jgi:hypothetical protein